MHPVAWAMYASRGQWQRAPHLQYLAEQLMRLHTGEITRLCVSMPPRHGKSELITQYFSTWWLGAHPGSELVMASYGEKLTRKWSRKGRDTLAEHGPAVFGCGSLQRASVLDWPVIRAGRRSGGAFAVGKGGGLTGRGFHLGIADDVVKGHKDAANPTLSQDNWDWFRSEFLTRVEPGGRAVVIATRWAHDDLIGRLERQQRRGEGGDHWEIINLPAIAEEDDPMGRAQGEALWPARYDVEALETIRKEVGPYVWSALYQGRPTPKTGGLMQRHWFTYFEEEGEWFELADGRRLRRSEMPIYQAADLATSKRAAADHTVICTFAIHPEKAVLLLLDVTRAKVEGPDITRLLHRTRDRWRAVTIYVESIGFQNMLIQTARRDGLPIREVYPDKDKFSRALPVTAALEGGNLAFRANAHWLPDLEHELMTFTGQRGGADDQVDALAYGVRVFLETLAAFRSMGDAQADDLGGIIGDSLM